MYGLEGLAISAYVLEDDLGGEDRSNDGTDSLNGLGQLETELRPLGRTTDGTGKVLVSEGPCQDEVT